MSGLNKIMLIGNVGTEPDLKFTSGGTPVLKFSLATNESYTDKNGNKKDEVEWHRCVLWGKAGESVHKYLEKGKQCYVEGKIKTTSYEDKDGIKRYSTNVVVRTVQFLGSKPRTGDDGEQPRRAAATKPSEASQDSAPDGFSEEDEEMPF